MIKILDQARKIGLDSMCFIYYLENNPQYTPVLKIIFKGLEEGRLVGIGSNLSLTEILIHPRYLKFPRLLKSGKELMLTLPNFSLIAPTDEICFKAATIGARYHLKPIDAIHLTTALIEKVDFFLTNDERLKVVKKPKVLLLPEVAA